MEKRANESQEESLERKDAAKMNKRRTNETPQLMLQRRKQNMQRMTIKRQLANDEEKNREKKKLLARMTRKRMNELEEEMIGRKKKNAARMNRKRANETEEEMIGRKRENAGRMTRKRTNETEEEMIEKKRENAGRMTRKRANETEEEMIERKRENAGRMTRKRANETEEEMIERKRENACRMTRKRANETEEKIIERKRVNNQRMSAKCNRSSMVVVMKHFHSQVKVGPVCVCTVCHRLIYREGVVKVKVSRYKKSSSELLQKVFAVKFHIKSFNKQGWICKTCNLALMKGKMPIQAKANRLSLDKVPQELSDLNSLELRLISMRIPIMKMIALPRGQ